MKRKTSSLGWKERGLQVNHTHIPHLTFISHIKLRGFRLIYLIPNEISNPTLRISSSPNKQYSMSRIRSREPNKYVHI